MGVDLFLDGMSSPTISASNARMSSAAPMSNDGELTGGGYAGPRSVIPNGQSIALTGFSFGSYEGDLVGQQAIGASGTTDYRGSLTVTVSSVPEPATILLLGTGLVGVALVARRRRIS